MDEDCTLEEEEDGPVEDEDEIDQYNDDTFGAGAIGEYWRKSLITYYLYTMRLSYLIVILQTDLNGRMVVLC